MAKKVTKNKSGLDDSSAGPPVAASPSTTGATPKSKGKFPFLFPLSRFAFEPLGIIDARFSPVIVSMQTHQLVPKRSKHPRRRVLHQWIWMIYLIRHLVKRVITLLA